MRRLLDEGIQSFIARYRKEATGELDETVLRSIAEKLGYYRSLEERKQESFGSSMNRASSPKS